MSEPADKPDLPNDVHPALPKITGKADPLPEPLVLVLAFFGSGTAGYFLNLMGVGILGLAIGSWDAKVGHYGGLNLNLSALACAMLGVAVAMAAQRRAIRGFAMSAVAGLAIACLIAWGWHARVQHHGFDPGEVSVALWPFVVSATVVAISVLGLTVAALVRRNV